MPVLVFFVVVIAIIGFKSIKIVRQSEVFIIERLGRFHKIADAGLTVIFPFVDKVRSVVSLKQALSDIFTYKYCSIPLYFVLFLTKSCDEDFWSPT